jgi:hypothetical protein
MSRLHPDLQLGIVLVAAALLLAMSAPHVLLDLLIDELDVSAADLGVALSGAGLGGLATIGTAIWLDRRGPHPMMAIGAAIALAGSLLLLVASNLPTLWLANFVRAIGTAGFASIILYAVVVKGATRHRGLLLGAIVAVSVGPWEVARHVAGSSNLTDGILFSAVVTAIAAFVLYRFLPRVFEERAVMNRRALSEPASLRAVFGTPGFWRVFGPLLGVAALVLALSSTTSWFLHFMFNQTDSEFDGPFRFVGLPVVTAMVALGMGAAADRLPARNLLMASAVAVVGLVVVASVSDGWIRSGSAGLAGALVRGGIAVLPWVLLAQLITVRHFAVVALIVIVLSRLLGGFLPALGGFAVDWLGQDAWLYVVHLPVAVALLAVAFWIAKRPLAYRQVEATPDGADSTR